MMLMNPGPATVAESITLFSGSAASKVLATSRGEVFTPFFFSCPIMGRAASHWYRPLLRFLLLVSLTPTCISWRPAYYSGSRVAAESNERRRKRPRGEGGEVTRTDTSKGCHCSTYAAGDRTEIWHSVAGGVTHGTRDSIFEDGRDGLDEDDARVEFAPIVAACTSLLAHQGYAAVAPATTQMLGRR